MHHHDIPFYGVKNLQDEFKFLPATNQQFVQFVSIVLPSYYKKNKRRRKQTPTRIT
jgi:hypothetical protein